MGQHCSDQSCKQLDYLPMKCDACSQLFCKDHLMYDDHSCRSKYKKDIQVPVCPLCSAPVPTPRGTLPDLAVGAHIDSACKSKPREKVFTNRCNRARCKKRELVPVICDACHLNFCLSHRHPKDHDCEGPRAVNQRRIDHFSAGGSRSTVAGGGATGGASAKITNFFRSSQSNSSSSSVAVTASAERVRATAASSSALLNGMTEDEALAAALAASMQDVSPPATAANTARTSPRGLTQEEEDRQLAMALQESLRSSQPQQQQQQQQSCSLS